MTTKIARITLPLSLFGAGLVGGCGAPQSAMLSGHLENGAFALDNSVVIAETLAGTRYATHVRADLSFQLTIPVGETYKLSLANTTRAGTYHVISRIDVATETGPSRYAVIADAGAYALGAVRPIDWTSTPVAKSTSLLRPALLCA